MPDPSDVPPMAHPRVAAGALIRDGVGRALMVRPTYKDGWDIPGGYVEPGESPAAALARELREELGIDRAAGRLLVMDWAPHPAEGDKLLFVFDGGTLDPGDLPGLILQQDEIAEVCFQPASAFFDLAPDRLARRLLLAVNAAASGVTRYAEHGVAVPAATGMTDDGSSGM